MDYLPICIDLRGRACLVVGGGEVALRKVELLHAAGADLRIVATAVCAQLAALARRTKLRVARRRYASRDLRAVTLVIAATDDAQVNARVAADAAAQGVLVNVVDAPALCSFIMPAIIDRSPVLVSVSTGGASPSLARLTRARVEAALPARLGQLAAFAARHRETVKLGVADPGERRLFWDRVLDGDIAQLLLDGRERDAEAALHRALAGEAVPGPAASLVALIGVGAGDPDALPLRALRCLARADLILHEASVPPAVLALARRDAERRSIGRLGARGGFGVERLVRAVIRRARLNRPVCVLRAGDPYARGPGGEGRLLQRAGVRFTLLRPAP